MPTTTDALSELLASTYVLYMKTLYYHWNVTGPQFHSLHTMFETQYTELQTAGDSLAERIRALGYKTPGSFHEFIDIAKIQEDQSLPTNATEMVKNLLSDNEALSAQAREVFEIAQHKQDEVTSDMMVGRMTVHDEAAWMLRVTLE